MRIDFRWRLDKILVVLYTIIALWCYAVFVIYMVILSVMYNLVTFSFSPCWKPNPRELTTRSDWGFHIVGLRRQMNPSQHDLFRHLQNHRVSSNFHKTLLHYTLETSLWITPSIGENHMKIREAVFEKQTEAAVNRFIWICDRLLVLKLSIRIRKNMEKEVGYWGFWRKIRRKLCLIQ